MRIGVDVVKIERVKDWPGNETIKKQVFSDSERELMKDLDSLRVIELMAGRFAVKEAVIKALGNALVKEINIAEIETKSCEKGIPYLQFHGEVKECVESLNLKEFCVSISHDAGIAVAMVVLL